MTERVFPPSFSPSGVLRCEGMTLRDHFASLAMQALIPVYWQTESEFDSVKTMIKCNVEAAYEYADAMLKQRSLTND